MAKLKLSELPRITSANPTDLVYVVQSNVSKSIFVTNLLSSATITGIAQSYIANSITSSNVAEGTNLYFTNTRVYSNISSALHAGNGISISNTTISANVISVAGYTGTVTLDTEDIQETPNLIFFNAYRGYSALNLTNKYLITSTANVGFTVSGFQAQNPNIYVKPGSSLIFEVVSFSNPLQILDDTGNLYNALTHFTNPALSTPDALGANAQNKILGILVISIPDSLAGRTLTYRGNSNVSMSGTIYIDKPEALVTTANVIQAKLPLQLPSFTDVEVQAIAGANGMLLFNTTNNKIQAYVSGIWVDLHSSDPRNRY